MDDKLLGTIIGLLKGPSPGGESDWLTGTLGGLGLVNKSQPPPGQDPASVVRPGEGGSILSMLLPRRPGGGGGFP
jgi:hypothetical protein